MAKKTYDQMKQLIKTHNNSTDYSDELVMAICWKESSFDDAAASSSSTATGLMQMTKAAVDTVNNNTPAGVRFMHAEMKDANRNVECGTYYLQILLKIWPNKITALEHYGTGTGYAANLLTCETCLKNNPTKWKDCLNSIHSFVGV